MKRGERQRAPDVCRGMSCHPCRACCTPPGHTGVHRSNGLHARRLRYTALRQAYGFMPGSPSVELAQRVGAEVLLVLAAVLAWLRFGLRLGLGLGVRG